MRKTYNVRKTTRRYTSKYSLHKLLDSCYYPAKLYPSQIDEANCIFEHIQDKLPKQICYPFAIYKILEKITTKGPQLMILKYIATKIPASTYLKYTGGGGFFNWKSHSISPPNKGYFVLLTVVLRLFKFIRKLTRIALWCKRVQNASKGLKHRVFDFLKKSQARR